MSVKIAVSGCIVLQASVGKTQPAMPVLFAVTVVSEFHVPLGV
jgi:hypothetical protein